MLEYITIESKQNTKSLCLSIYLPTIPMYQLLQIYRVYLLLYLQMESKHNTNSIN